VTVHIDRLVLRGVAAHERHLVAAGFERELARRLADPALLARLATGVGTVRPSLRATVQVRAGGSPLALGAAAATGVGEGLAR
jgi:hypothetical protein